MFKEKRELLKKIRSVVSDERLIARFDKRIDTFVNQEADTVSLKSVDALHPNDVTLYSELNESHEVLGRESLHLVAILKLNGGLGTTMGCDGPKSLITIRPGFTFLDCIVKQLLNCRKSSEKDIPFLLLNSKSTSEKTRSYIQDHFKITYDELFQIDYPRFVCDTMEPCKFLGEPEKEWAPGGHGDVYMSLYVSGTLETLLKKGVRYLFLSNSDNLGAELDLKILGAMVKSQTEFVMEVTPRTAQDVKGGTVVRYKGKKTLIERAQVSDEDAALFENNTRFPLFNTNNIWVDLRALYEKLLKNTLELPIIVNKKTISGVETAQLETAMGAAIQCFDKSTILVVPRSRFFPVKTMSDLLMIRSDIFDISNEGHVIKNPKRRTPFLPKIELDALYYDTVEKFETLFKDIPSLVEANSLTIEGPVQFQEATSIKGSVGFRYAGTTPVTIKGKYFENQHVDL